jgi:hypothetical protein
MFEYRPIEEIYLRLEGNMLMLSNSNHPDNAKVFSVGSELKNTRMEAAISLGYTFNLYEKVISE